MCETMTPLRRIWTARRGAVVVLLSAVVLAFVLALSVPRSAHAHDDGGPFHMEHHCVGGEVCLFEAINYDHAYYGGQGDFANYWPQIYEVGDDGHNHRLNDTSDSVDNDGVQCGTSHWLHANYAGNVFWLPQGNAIADLWANFENALSSHRWCS